MVKKLVTLIFLGMFLISFISATRDDSGMDTTFRYLGIEKPQQWDSWSMDQKFTYLQERGIYPTEGQRYVGEADTNAFFSDYLKMEKPADWDSMTFEEKITFNEETLSSDNIELEGKTNNSPSGEITDKSKKPSFPMLLILILSIFVVVTGFFKRTNRMNKFGKIVALYILPIVLILLAMFFGNYNLYIGMGFWAERLLIFLLFIKPVASILNINFIKRPCAYRLELGMSVFWLFLIHAIGLWIMRGFTLSTIFISQELLWGVIGGIALLIGAATSNKFSMRLLKINWKKVQMVAYFALLGTLLHTSIIAGNMMKFYVIFGTFILLKILEFKGVKLKK